MRPTAATERWAERIERRTRDRRRPARPRVIEAAQCRGGGARHRGRAARGRAETRKTAALVTPDRALARRVGAALGRWNIVANDSGGDALPDTEAGVFARAGRRSRARTTCRRCSCSRCSSIRCAARRGGHARACDRDAGACDPARTAPAAAAEGLLDRAGERSAQREAAPLRSAPASRSHLDGRAGLVARSARRWRRSRVTCARRHSRDREHAEPLQALSRDDAGNEVAFAGIDGAASSRAPSRKSPERRTISA